MGIIFSSASQPKDTPEAQQDSPEADYRPSMFQIKEDTDDEWGNAPTMRPGIHPRDSKRHSHP